MIKVSLVFRSIPGSEGGVAGNGQVDRNIAFDTSGTFAENENAVGKADSLREIVGYEDCCFFCGTYNIADIGGNGKPCLVIQGAERFIQQKDIRIKDKGAYQRGALLHSS